MFFTEDPHESLSDRLSFLRLHARCQSAGGWTIGEKFNDRFDTEVGGFSMVAEQWIEDGQLKGDWKRTADGSIESVRRVSVVVDYADNGTRYTIEEAQALPELAAVLARLQERESKYLRHLAKLEEAKARMAKRKSLLKAELRRHGVRFLPAQVMRDIYAKAGV